LPEGIRVRHGRNCRSLAGGNCNCERTFEASVWSPRDGKKLRKSFPTEAAARRWRVDAAKQVKDGKRRAPTQTTLRQAADEWLAGARDGTIRTKSGLPFKPSVTRGYTSSLNTKRKTLRGRSILDELGARKLTDVERPEVQDIADRLLAGGLDPSTVRNAVMPLRAIYRRAMSRGVVVVNPTTGLELRAVEGRRDRIAAPEEAAKLIGLLAKRDRAVWSTAVYAGLRLGELLALGWENVDLAAGVIRVRAAYDARSRTFILPKSKSGVRDVPLAAVLRDALDEHKLDTSRSEGLVFGRTEAEPFSTSSLCARSKRAWLGAEKKRLAAIEAGEPADSSPVVPLGLHEARHSYASMMIAAGVNAKALSTFMGHSSISITLDRYGHLMPGAHDEAAGLLDAYLERANTQARLAQVG
jgi:integrase